MFIHISGTYTFLLLEQRRDMGVYFSCDTLSVHQLLLGMQGASLNANRKFGSKFCLRGPRFWRSKSRRADSFRAIILYSEPEPSRTLETPTKNSENRSM